MQKAKLDGTTISYLDEGTGQPVVLLHGFASNAHTNWFHTGWFKALTAAGYRAMALDNRGHGESTKYYEETDYLLEKMAADVDNLIDHLGLEAPHVMGYSMGCRITVTLAKSRGASLGKLVLAGNGYNMIEGGFDTNIVRDALLADSMENASPGVGRQFREFAEKTGNDLKALAACIRGQVIPEDVLRSIKNETLVIVGDEDDFAVDGERLASIMPNAHFEPIPKRNHMNAVGDKVYKAKVVEFLGK